MPSKRPKYPLEDEEKDRNADGSQRKQHIPAEPVQQRPGELPIGNGGVNAPAAFPPHN